jgi:hypothetical protein
MKTSHIKTTAALAAAFSLVLTVAVSAETTTASSTGAKVTVREQRQERLASTTAVRTDKARERGTDMIDQRIDSLTKLIARVDAMKHISATDKSALEASLNAEITALNALKATVSTATSTGLKNNIASITKAYRVYALVEPQAQIIAAADRALGVTDSLTTLLGKLSTRLASTTLSASTTAAVQASLTDLSAQIASSSASAHAAISLVASLKPDNGDATIAAANKIALKNARAAVVAAQQALKLAEKDIRTIIKAVIPRENE